jgi:hypothetical protein
VTSRVIVLVAQPRTSDQPRDQPLDCDSMRPRAIDRGGKGASAEPAHAPSPLRPSCRSLTPPSVQTALRLSATPPLYLPPDGRRGDLDDSGPGTSPQRYTSEWGPSTQCVSLSTRLFFRLSVCPSVRPSAIIVLHLLPYCSLTPVVRNSVALSPGRGRRASLERRSRGELPHRPPSRDRARNPTHEIACAGRGGRGSR